MKQNMGIRRRLAPLMENDKKKWFLINALFLSLPGVPIVYYGDEIGMGDNIWLPDRHGLRTPMQWDDSKNAGFSDAAEPYFPVIDDAVFGYQRVNVAAQEGDPDSYLNLMRHLLKVRGSQPALRRGDFSFVETGNDAVLAFRRDSVHFSEAGVQSVLCVFNLSDAVQVVSLEGERPYQDILHPESKPVQLTNLELAPRAAHWFSGR